MFTISCSEFDPEVCGIRYCISLVCGIRYSLNSILSLPFAVFDIDLRFLVWIRSWTLAFAEFRYGLRFCVRIWSWTLAIYGIRSVCGSELQFDLERLSFAVFDWFAVLVCGFHRPESELSQQQCDQKILRFWEVILRFWKCFPVLGMIFAILEAIFAVLNALRLVSVAFCGAKYWNFASRLRRAKTAKVIGLSQKPQNIQTPPPPPPTPRLH